MPYGFASDARVRPSDEPTLFQFYPFQKKTPPACIPSQPPCSDIRRDITTTGPERAEIPVSRVRAQDAEARQRERGRERCCGLFSYGNISLFAHM